eukprot:CAMPEP_0183297266 /NCGR_PEP_ID=MMETSP0160_2-20130417/4606_1 /TAXON_ID=2839 ORGANISM="Odontella Sinensis, Strain Grunow 1884" /NCGR_SAMPLE_ID=MMETSP0160_2 /ASSEMBLY_ACC=CAM_ASM_000250 /LENGTH=64 /DNA_ID=CAMNT_0025459053 /DNA_START=73 /DNA_END=267 /DNA_ORIENTATION=+
MTSGERQKENTGTKKQRKLVGIFQEVAVTPTEQINPRCLFALAALVSNRTQFHNRPDRNPLADD